MASGVISKKKLPARERARRPSSVGASVAAEPIAESRAAWLRRLRAEYTPAVCAQTLQVNEDFPLYGKP